MSEIEKKFKNELVQLLKNLGLSHGDKVFVTGNLASLGRLRIFKNRKMEILFDSIFSVIGKDSTIFSPSASMNLCNTSIPFDIKNTPSDRMGAFAEYLRKLPASVRSNHPFWSVSGIGKDANILKKVSKHAFGIESPWSHFLDMDVKQLNFGLHPSKAVTLIHHIETIYGVPYRYTKEFNHPILKNGKITKDFFYQSVMYVDSDIKKRVLLNEHYFESLKEKKLLHENTHETGLKLWCFKMKDFYNEAITFFNEDIYNYLEYEPKIKPYQK